MNTIPTFTRHMYARAQLIVYHFIVDLDPGQLLAAARQLVGDQGSYMRWCQRTSTMMAPMTDITNPAG